MGHAIADNYFGDSAAGFDRAGVDIRANCFAVLNVWFKSRQSADAPDDQQVALYQKSKASVFGMDYCSGG
jgi:Caspase domain